mgnify:CR=1 FL=1
MSVTEEIRMKLQDAFDPSDLEVQDDSESHRGHAGYRDGGESHFNVRIRAAAFGGQSRIQRHRAVHRQQRGFGARDVQVEQRRDQVHEDHHYFTHYEMAQLRKKLDEMEDSQKIILTTEKDATRMWLHKDFIEKENLPIFVLPIEVVFHGNDGEHFLEQIKQSLLEFQS